MADNTAIEWADATWNPTVGCSVLSPGCTNCYAMRTAWRQHQGEKYAGLTRQVNGNPVWTGAVRLHEPALDWPLLKRKPLRIFVNSMSDLFHESLPDEVIDQVFAVMALCPQHIFLVLTKRAQRMRDYFERCRREDRALDGLGCWHGAAAPILGDRVSDAQWEDALGLELPLDNVWIGVSVEDQARADERIPLLLDTPASKRFISAEPLLGPINLSWITRPGWSSTQRKDALSGEYNPSLIGMAPEGKLDWVIVGGESGPAARPMLRCWAQSLRDQFRASGVAFFYKQTGEWIDADELIGLIQRGEYELVPGECFTATKTPLDFTTAAFLADFSGKPYEHQSDGSTLIRLGKKAAGRLLDGREWNEFPDSHSPDAGDDGIARAHR